MFNDLLWSRCYAIRLLSSVTVSLSNLAWLEQFRSAWGAGPFYLEAEARASAGKLFTE